MFLVILPLIACGEESETSWSYDTSPVLEQEAGETTESEEREEEGLYGKWLWVEAEGELAETGFYYATEEAEHCLVLYGVSSWEDSSDCEACDEAWTITRGESEVLMDREDACSVQGFLGLEGTSLGLGLKEEQLWAELGSGWEAVAHYEIEYDPESDWILFGIFLGE